MVLTSRSIQLGPSARVVDAARANLTLLCHDGFRALAYQLSVPRRNYDQVEEKNRTPNRRCKPDGRGRVFEEMDSRSGGFEGFRPRPLIDPAAEEN